MAISTFKKASDTGRQTRFFRTLVWLNRPHSAALRGAFASLAFIQVLIVTGLVPLAHEAARLWARDRFKTGAHRLDWYLHYGWMGHIMTRLTGRRGREPLVDPTTEMDAGTVPILARWLALRCDVSGQLAQLYVLARQILDADNADSQAGLLTRFEDTASNLCSTLPVLDPTVPTGTAARPDFTLDDALASLAALDRALPMPWYIISGTFLGAVREGTFLSHDYDVDIGIHAEDFDEATFLEAIYAASDLTIVNTSAHLHLTNIDCLLKCRPLPALYRVMHSSGVGIDVFVHHLDGEKRWHGSAKHRWDNHDFALENYTIAGLPVLGPADADRYLTENYGDWRTPIKSFNCSTGTPNVSFTRNLSMVAETLSVAIQRQGTPEAMVAQHVLRTEGYLTDDDLTECGVRFVIPWRTDSRLLLQG